MGQKSNYRSVVGEQQVLKKYDELIRHWPVEKITHEISTRHGTTHVIECGSPENPPLVLLHGASGNSLMWMNQVHTYLKSHRIYVIDIIGEVNHSDSARLKLKTRANVEWLEDVLQHLNIKRPAMAGFSFGAWLCLKFAAAWPDRVERLALISPSGIVGLRKSFRFKQLMLTLVLGPFAKRHTLRRLLLQNQDNKQMEMNQLIAQYFKPRSWALPAPFKKNLPPLYCPVLLMLGGKDPLYKADKTLLKITKQIHQLELIYRDNEGHFLDDYTRELDRFLITNFAPD